MRLRSNAETLDVAERQRIVRLVVKEVLVGENDITIRHSIPIPSGSPPNGGSPSAGDPNYLLCKGSGFAAAQQSVHAPVRARLEKSWDTKSVSERMSSIMLMTW